MNLPAPLVTAIVAVKNGAALLEDALRSIVAQTHAPIEIIVVDGHSTDRTAEIAQSFSSVRYFVQSGRGVADAYNQGVENARGEYVAFLSHDDVWAADKIARQVAYLRERTETDYVICHLRWERLPGTPVPPGFRVEQLHTAVPGLCMETLLARRRVFEVVGPFDTRLTSAEDADWFARANDCGMVRACLPEVLLRKRVCGTNLTFATHITPVNNKDLLAILHASIRRKRGEE